MSNLKNNGWLKWIIIGLVPALIWGGIAISLSNKFGFETLFGLLAFAAYAFSVYYLVKINNRL